VKTIQKHNVNKNLTNVIYCVQKTSFCHLQNNFGTSKCQELYKKTRITILHNQLIINFVTINTAQHITTRILQIKNTLKLSLQQGCIKLSSAALTYSNDFHLVLLLNNSAYLSVIFYPKNNFLTSKLINPFAALPAGYFRQRK